MGINTGLYLTELQHERLLAMASAKRRKPNNFIRKLLDDAWIRYLEEKEDSSPSPTETKQEATLI